MCGICAGVGNSNQVESVITGLKNLEYRGYDSSGIAFKRKNQIEQIKSVGEIKNLQQKIVRDLSSNIIISHTRWATHGQVTEENAHPQLSFDGRFALVHNGIVENFEELRESFLKDVKFNSQTDTEVFVNLIAKQKCGSLDALIFACSHVKGSFALAMLDEKSENIYLAKRNSPLYVAQTECGFMAGSDISVFPKNVENCYVMEDDEFAVINSKKVIFYDKNRKKIDKNAIFIKNFNFNEEINNEKYFMLKEIKEQPIVLKRTYFEYFSDKFLSEEVLKKIDKFNCFHFVACGTAYHSCLLGAKYIQKFCHKKCDVSVASEFRYDDNVFSKKCLFIFVSQSGETADTIACAKLVKEKGLTCMGVTNVPYCTLNKIVDFVLPTFAGREIAVASTKAYSAQVFTLLIFALKLSDNFQLQRELKRFVLNFTISDFDMELFKQISKFKKIFFIGRGNDFVTSLEGALKLKEISYINCTGMAAGELKHGTLALVDDETLVIAISTNEDLKEKVESNIQEVRARGGKVLLLSNLDAKIAVDFLLKLPSFEQCLMPIVSIVPLQLLALHFSLSLGYNPDKPRNLAKSVTVE